MSKVKVKGTQLQQSLAGVFTAVAQLTGITMSGAESETVETDPLSNLSAGIEMSATGRTASGSIGFEIMFDLALQGHKNLTALLTSPGSENWKIVDSNSVVLTATSVGIGLDLNFDTGDIVRGSGSLELTGDIGWPV